MGPKLMKGLMRKGQVQTKDYSLYKPGDRETQETWILQIFPPITEREGARESEQAFPLWGLLPRGSLWGHPFPDGICICSQ